VKLLLDSHSIIWFLDGSSKLSKNARNVIEDENNIKFISSASLWEIAIKISLKKADFSISFVEFVSLIELNGFDILPIKTIHSLEVSQLPFFHRDPFDRMLVAQALVDELVVVTKDDWIKLYSIKAIW
jgi:PIN domain nuclease of toxin-antitoxin system